MRRLRRWFNRGPVFGPPLPACDERGWRSWHWCELPLHHEGKHGRVIGTSSHTGPLVSKSSTTWEMWS